MGGLKKIKPKGGSGGKRGHSRMEHWAYTAEIKDAARTQRRLEDKKLSREGKNEISRKSTRKDEK